MSIRPVGLVYLVVVVFWKTQLYSTHQSLCVCVCVAMFCVHVCVFVGFCVITQKEINLGT